MSTTARRAAVAAMSVAELRAAIAENSATFRRDGYSRENELDGYLLRGALARADPTAPDVQRDAALWRRDGRA